jgi:hypothetical protein
LRQQPLRGAVVGLAIEREPEVVDDVIVSRVHQGFARQLRQLADEGPVQLARVTAVVAVAGAGVEQRIPAEQRRRVGMRQQADVAHGMPRGVERLQLDALADLDRVAGGEPAIDSRDALRRIPMRQQPGAGGRDHGAIAAGMVAVLVRVQDLGDLPTVLLRRGQTLLVIQGIDRQRLARVRADDEVVEVAIRVGGPDLMDDHGGSLASGARLGPMRRVNA